MKTKNVKDEKKAVVKRVEKLNHAPLKAKPQTQESTITVSPLTKEKAEVSRYGHRVGSMSGAIDDLLWKGVKIDDAVKTLVKDFKRAERLAKNKFLSHVAYLPKHRGVKVEISGDHYKSLKEKI